MDSKTHLSEKRDKSSKMHERVGFEISAKSGFNTVAYDTNTNKSKKTKDRKPQMIKLQREKKGTLTDASAVFEG